MLYRVRKPLSTGQQRGDIVRDDDFDAGVVAKLVQVGALSPVDGPPLTELPGWEWRARMLARAGIVTVADLLGTEDEVIRNIVNYKTTRAIERWKREALEWLAAPDDEKCRRC